MRENRKLNFRVILKIKHLETLISKGILKYLNSVYIHYIIISKSKKLKLPNFNIRVQLNKQPGSILFIFRLATTSRCYGSGPHGKQHSSVSSPNYAHH
jgi:hypothetical protein